MSPRLTLRESILPERRLGLPGDIATNDELLDDERSLEPFFDPVIGRPAHPIATTCG